jgi:hypothetical protein
MIQTGSALAVGDQKAQKHAEGHGAFLRRRPSRPLTGIQDELPKALSIKPVRIFSQVLQQITHMLAHPATERNQQGWVRNDLLCDSGRD